MSDALAGLTPRPVWEHFSAIARIPRPSKREDRIVAHVLSLAERNRLPVRRDAAGNLVIDVPASPGHEAAPVVVLQGHLDMVCEKNGDVEHDFDRDPIEPQVLGDWVQAKGTTLGADNGIGVAAALSAATEESVVRPPLQLLFTVDEETGLTGAKGLDGSLLRGRTLVNLDSEEDGVVFVGCAGGADTVLTVLPLWGAPGAGRSGTMLEVKGLRGGHSGLNIHENRGNAIKLVGHVLFAAAQAGVPFQLGSVSGGSMHNAIPREASAGLALASQDEARMRGVVESMVAGFRTELQGIDEGLTVQLLAAPVPERVLDDAGRDRLLGLLVGLPHGVLGMSPAIPGLVETSNNLAVVRPENGRIRIVTSSRSSVGPTLRAVQASIRAQGLLAGAQMDTRDGYPGWKPNLQSPVLGTVRAVYRTLWGADPKVTAIHAGLECGLIGEKVPGMDMVSFGPQIEGAHSPDERVSISSVGRFWEALRRVLEQLAG